MARWSLTKCAHRRLRTTNSSTYPSSTGSSKRGKFYNDSDEGFHNLLGRMSVIGEILDEGLGSGKETMKE